MTRYCQHGKRRNECKDCKGSSICVHGRRTIRCPQCLGSCICNHGRIRSQCHLCGGSSICFHGKRKSYCKQCGGLSFCPHGKRRGTKCKGCASDKHISFAAEDTVDLRSRNGSEVLLFATDATGTGGFAVASSKVRCSLLVSLQPGERQELMKVLAQKDDYVVIDAFISGSSAKIFAFNLKCVRKGEWLNSETINVYVMMIEAVAKSAGLNVTSFNSYFVSQIETQVSQL